MCELTTAEKESIRPVADRWSFQRLNEFIGNAHMNVEVSECINPNERGTLTVDAMKFESVCKVRNCNSQ